jgi:tripartite-type tricarboxylate transporter receptor subunit TctC
MKHLLWLAMLLVCGWAAPGGAEDRFPSRPIKIIVPTAAGGVTDVQVRRLSPRLARVLGQPVVIDNRPGASGLLGLNVGLSAAPDGYTLVVGSTSTLAVSPALGVQGRFDPRKDFEPVFPYLVTPMLLVSHPSLQVSTLNDLVGLARAKPGQLFYGSAGPTTTPHAAGEILKQVTGIALTHVPYKGTAPAMLAVMANEVQLAFDFPASAVPQVKAGKLKALMVGGSRRIPLLPDVPTARESGYPDLDFSAWGGILAPAGTPQAFVQRLNAALAEAVGPELKAQLAQEGTEPLLGSPQEFRQLILSEQARWARLIKAAGIKAEQ